MIVVSNTSPLIGLATVGQLNLLQQLYGHIIIPQAVYDEVTALEAGYWIDSNLYDEVLQQVGE